MGRSRESGLQFSSLAPKVKTQGREKAYPASDTSASVQLHGEGTKMVSRVTEEEGHLKRRRWSIRVRRGKLVTPVVRYLKRFRHSCSSIAAIAAAPLRLPGCYKLGVLLAKLHLSRKRNSRKVHSIHASSSASDEHAPLLALCDPQV